MEIIPSNRDEGQEDWSTVVGLPQRTGKCGQDREVNAMNNDSWNDHSGRSGVLKEVK